MPKTIVSAKVINPYRSNRPKGFYHPVKGHTGIDLQYVNEDLRTPVTGIVRRIARQKEMGLCIYQLDAWSNVHVFAHLKDAKVSEGKWVDRGKIIAKTGNSGSKTTNPHLHYEIIVTGSPFKPQDITMTRKLWQFKGWNTDPIAYLRYLYEYYGVDILTGKKKDDGGWIGEKKITAGIPKWLLKK